MKKLADNVIMSDAYCEITDCRNIKNCEKCVELNIAEHDKRVKADAIEEFVKFANTMPTVEENDGEIRPMWLEEMAEQLKGEE